MNPKKNKKIAKYQNKIQLDMKDLGYHMLGIIDECSKWERVFALKNREQILEGSKPILEDIECMCKEADLLLTRLISNSEKLLCISEKSKEWLCEIKKEHHFIVSAVNLIDNWEPSLRLRYHHLLEQGSPE